MTKGSLKAIIDKECRWVRFSGSTYEVRDQIKLLGEARWLADAKVWEVRSPSASAAELKERFPGIEIVEDGVSQSNEGTGEGATAPAGVNTYSVSEVISRAESALRHAFAPRALVYGVISKVNRSSGRLFLELADRGRPEVHIGAVVWRNAEKVCEGLTRAGFAVEVGLEVMLETEVGLNPRNGSISLTILRIVEEFTVGRIAAQRDLTNKRLREEGIFNRNRSLQLSFLPSRLGILTSATGTVIHDFRVVLEEAEFGFELFWCHTQVQGGRARDALLDGLQCLLRVDGLDAILIFRGGGSPAELAVFNDYELTRAVCHSPIPVLAAIGHQEDQSSVQDVSFRSFGVPRDLGHFFAELVRDYRKRLRQYIKLTHTLGIRVAEVSDTHVARLGVRLMDGGRHHLLRAIERLMLVRDYVVRGGFLCEERCRTRLRLKTQLTRDFERLLEARGQSIERFEQRILDAAPEVQLRRGFALVRQGDTLVNRGEGLEETAAIEIEFHDMRRTAVVTG